jgi:hypothetical protein
LSSSTPANHEAPLGALARPATEFGWARRLLASTRQRCDKVTPWFRRQGVWAQAPGASFTGAVAVATLWLFGAVGCSAEALGLEHEWLKSPIGLGA